MAAAARAPGAIVRKAESFVIAQRAPVSSPLLFAVLDLWCFWLDPKAQKKKNARQKKSIPYFGKYPLTFDSVFPARSGFTTFCHRKVAPKKCPQGTSVGIGRRFSLSGHKRLRCCGAKRLHRFDCGGSAKSASGLCTRLLPVVFARPGARTAVRSVSSSGAMRSLWCAPRDMIYSDVIPLYSIWQASACGITCEKSGSSDDTCAESERRVKFCQGYLGGIRETSYLSACGEH